MYELSHVVSASFSVLGTVYYNRVQSVYVDAFGAVWGGKKGVSSLNPGKRH